MVFFWWKKRDFIGRKANFSQNIQHSLTRISRWFVHFGKWIWFVSFIQDQRDDSIGFRAMARAADSSQHKPQSDKGSVSRANTTAPSLQYSIIKDLHTVSVKMCQSKTRRERRYHYHLLTGFKHVLCSYIYFLQIGTTWLAILKQLL